MLYNAVHVMCIYFIFIAHLLKTCCKYCACNVHISYIYCTFIVYLFYICYTFIKHLLYILSTFTVRIVVSEHELYNCVQKLYNIIHVLKNKNFTSGAMYCSVPVKVSVLGHIPANRLLVPKSDILTTPL